MPTLGLARRLRAALAIAVWLTAFMGSPLAGGPAPAAATDCVTYYCAYLGVTFSGDGYAHAVDDQGVLDCYYNAGSYFGTCTHAEYYWIGESSPTLRVTVTATGYSHSYTCNFDLCGSIDGSEPESITLNRNDSKSVVFEAHLAPSLTWTAHVSGTGAGHITSSPAGIDCSYASSATSGTCSSTWYFIGSATYHFSFLPDSRSYVCVNAGSVFCEAVGKSLSLLQPVYQTSTITDQVTFTRGTKLTVAVQGKGEVLGSVGGLICPSACTRYYKPGTAVSLSASPAAGYRLAGWTGACQLVTTSTCDLSVGSADLATTAIFASTATPPPTPQPTPKPTPAPGRTAAATIAPTLGPTIVPSAAPYGSPAAGTSAVPSEPTTAGASPSPGEVAVGTTAAPTPPDAAAGGAGTESPDSSGGSGPDLVPIGALIALLLLLVLALGFVMGRRGRRPSDLS